MTLVPGRRDAVLSLVTALVTGSFLALAPLAEAADPEIGLELPRAGSGPWWLVVGTVVAQLLLLAWLKRAPGVVLSAVAALPFVVAAAPVGAAFSATTVPVLVAGARAVALRGVGWVLLLVLVLVGGAHLVHERAAPQPLLTLVQGLSIVVVPAVLGAFLSSQRVAREAQRAQIQALAREREALVEAVLARERTAMARELHDIAAHHLSGIALMAGAVGRQIDSDPGAAKVGVEQLRAQATSVLGDLRRLVGLMRTAEHARSAGTGVESIAGIACLVAQHPGEVSLDAPSEMQADGVGPLAQLAAYRTVQEALANATRHAPGAPCHVEVIEADDAITVTVRNEPAASTVPPSGDAGFGLLGMRERAELTGSDLRHGRTPDGGWEVVLRLPREPDRPKQGAVLRADEVNR